MVIRRGNSKICQKNTLHQVTETKPPDFDLNLGRKEKKKKKGIAAMVSKKEAGVPLRRSNRV